MLNNWYK
ncbi:uncharacterized protein FFE2_16071 [Fusarium fujikuroi]|nr:uncharacterized protein FFE2_16058 [Fusarium fujikuroi]SCO24869.1 uncharacterized protein FFE2_16071 [Fusarium fujikuroi]